MTARSAGGDIDRPLAITSVVVVLGAFMTILDTTIVNVAIERLSREFDSDLATIQWVSTGYLLALATVIPLTGWAADRFGTKRLYLISVSLFVLGSMLAGTAQSAEQLIAYRVLQGLGGGMVMPCGITILSRAAGPDRVGRTMSIVGVPMLMAPIVGPILGGAFVDADLWRWIFFVNVPIGLLTLALAHRILPRDIPDPHERLDWKGLLLLSPGLSIAVFGLAETASDGGIGSTRAWLPIIVGLALTAAFAAHAARIDYGLIDMRLMRERTMRASSATTMLFSAAFFSAMFLIPLYYQVVRGLSALDAGLLLAPQGLGAALMMPLAGRYTDSHGPGRVVLLGLTLVVAGLTGFTQIGAATPYWETAAFQFTLGLGMGATMMPSMAAAYQTMSQAQVARATTALNIIQRVGGAIGIALLSVMLSHSLTDALAPFGGASHAGISAVETMPEPAKAQLAPAAADAFGDTFWWAAAFAALAALPALMLPRSSPPNRVEHGSPEA